MGGNEDEHHTKTGSVLGSPRYMSPEQTRASANVDARADIWSCGVILFEGLTGTWPHEGDSFSALVVAICTSPPQSIDRVAPELPEPVRSIVRDCLRPFDERIRCRRRPRRPPRSPPSQDPSLAERPLARPLHAPSEAIKASSGVRVRPLLTTTAGNSAIIALQGFLDTDTSTDLKTTPIAPAQVSSARPSPAFALLPPAPPPLARLAGGGVALHEAALAPPLPAPAPAPASKAQLKTMPFPAAGSAMREELVRRGLVPPGGGVTPDTLTGTLETLATTTLREPPGASAPPNTGSPLPAPPSSGASFVGRLGRRVADADRPGRPFVLLDRHHPPCSWPSSAPRPRRWRPRTAPRCPFTFSRRRPPARLSERNASRLPPRPARRPLAPDAVAHGQRGAARAPEGRGRAPASLSPASPLAPPPPRPPCAARR